MSDLFSDPSPPETFAPAFKPPKITIVVDDAMVERAARVLADSWGPKDQAIAEWTRTVAAKMLAKALTP